MKPYAVIRLEGLYSDSERMLKPSWRSLTERRQRFRFDEFLKEVEGLLAAKADRILIDCTDNFTPGLFANMEAIAQQLARLRRADKRLLFFAQHYGTAALYLGAVCHERYIHRLGTLSFRGFHAAVPFLRGLLRKQNLDVEVYRQGDYKSAYDMFRLERMDPSQRPVYQELVDARQSRFLDTVSSGLGKTRKSVLKLAAGASLNAEAAVSGKWVDAVFSLDTYLYKRRQNEPKRKEYKPRTRPHRLGRKGPRCALLFLNGTIKSGKNERHPLLGTMCGSGEYGDLIDDLRADRSVKGVLLRISSGGGSATASYDLYEKLYRLSAEKPLVVSMGGMAASGAYWLSLSADRIFCERTTLTGSIGVIAALAYIGDRAKQEGVRVDTVQTTKSSDIYSAWRRRTSAEKKRINDELESVYTDFIEHVTYHRKLTPQQAEAAAAGRVWGGDKAAKMKLVDELGGIDDAGAYLRERLGARSLRWGMYPRPKLTLLTRMLQDRLHTFLPTFANGGDSGRLLRAAADLWGPVPLTLAPETVLALPETVSYLGGINS